MPSRGRAERLRVVRTEIVDTRTDTRWGDDVRRAVEHGDPGSLSTPLVIDEDEEVSGALYIYARRADAFDEDARAAATGSVLLAAVSAGNLYAHQRARSTADDLQTALESRAVIDQAEGVLVERYRLTPDQAFQLLAQTSMNANRKVQGIAQALVHSGELPVVVPRGNGRRRAPGRSAPGAPGHS